MKLIIGLSAFFRTSVRFMKYVSINKCQSFLIKYYPSTSYQCGFRKGFNLQHCIPTTLEKWRETIDKGDCFGALLTNLLNVFDCILHKYLIVKLHAYGVDMKSLRFLYSYLNGKKQRVKVNDKYSSFEEILFGVSQGSILGSLLFNISISYLFLILNNKGIASYVDENTPYCSYKNFEDVMTYLERTAGDHFTWFNNNGMKANVDKCHFLLSIKEKLKANISNYTIVNSDKEKLLGITIDNYLKFGSQIKNLCSKASQKLYSLSRVSLYVSLNQRRMIMLFFIMPQFGYCSLIWTNHNWSLNSINRIHD